MKNSIVITNESNTLFLTILNNFKIQWTDNLELAYMFESEKEAITFEETTARDFLQYETKEFSYVRNINELNLVY